MNRLDGKVALLSGAARGIGGAAARRMVEAGAKEASEAQVVEALDRAHAAIKDIVAVIDDLKKEVGKKKVAVAKKEIAPAFYKEIEGKVFQPLAKAMRIREKLENYETVEATLKGLLADLPETEAAELQRLEGVEVAVARAPQPSSPCMGDEPYLQSTRATRLA